MFSTDKPCDFCRERSLQWMHTPIESLRGMEVVLCENCGLIQSISTREYLSHPAPSMSVNADRASIRYTKDIILGEHTALIEEHLDFSQFETVLDVGSNRGAFVNWTNSNYPGREITGIEPDASVVDGYADRENVTVFLDRFENVSLREEHFDFAHCTHTLEHAVSAAEMYFGMCRSLKVGGILFLVVPNTLSLDPDWIEEIFIDPHTFHFNHSLLSAFAKENGLEILFEATSEAGEIQLILRKVRPSEPDFRFASFDRELAGQNRTGLEDYRALITRNRKRLKTVGRRLNAFGEGRLVIWGAGRILDALVRIGGLETHRVDLLVDKYLYKYMDDIHGIPLHSVEKLDADMSQEGVIFVASRDYAVEISEEATRYPNMEVVTYGDLIRTSR